MSETFRAQVQYGDWEGRCQADNADSNDLQRLLRDQNYIDENEFVVCVRFDNAENLSYQKHLAPVYVSVYTVVAKNYEAAQAIVEQSGPVRVQEVRFQLSVDDFARLFKRLSIAFSWQTLGLMGRELEISNSNDR